MCSQPYYSDMRKKKLWLILFLVLTGVNLLVFFFRDHFQYRPQAIYRSLYQTCDPACAEKWSRMVDDYPASEYDEAKKIMDSVLNDSLSGFDRVLFTASFLYEKFHRQLGTPSAELAALSPLQQYRLLSTDTSQKLWCGQFAAMFTYFAWTQDVASRYIEMMKPGDRHVLNEAYIPELGRWVMVDITNNLLSIRNFNGAFLDLVAVRDSVASKSELSIYRSRERAPEKVQLNAGELPSYYQQKWPLYYHHRISNEAVYSFKEKIKRYFLPTSWYEIFDDKGGDNALFQVKRVLFALWLLSFFVFLISLAKFRI